MPIQVLQLDITQPITPLYLSKEHESHRILIKSGVNLLGWISITKRDTNVLEKEELIKLIQGQIGFRIVNNAIATTLEIADDGKEKPISIVVCTRNRSNELRNCIQSLLNLAYKNYEILIIDNAPANDDTLQLTSSLPVRYIREETPGLNWARNRGIKEANHNIIAFTDDDALVDKNWLRVISQIFSREEVMGASGFVAPAELETQAQKIFELNYGGMGHGFIERVLKKDIMLTKELLWVSNVCIGANMAFRKSAFDSIGGFDTALDVGTPSNGAGDIEICHRLVANNHVFVYHPSMLVWHYHRKDMTGLKKQVYNNGRSFGCFLLDCYKKKTVGPYVIIKFFILDWLVRWNLKNLLKPRTRVPRILSLAELKGMVSSPYAYRQTKRHNLKMLENTRKKSCFRLG